MPTPAKERRRVSVRLLLLALVLFGVGLGASSASARTTRLYENSFGSFPSGSPQALAVDQSSGDVYAFESGGTVSRFTPAGTPDNFTAGPAAGTNKLTGLSTPGGVAIDNSGGPLNGNVYVTDLVHHEVEVYASDGAPLGVLKGTGNNEGAFTNPCGVAVDQSNGDVYVVQANGAGAYGKVWRLAQASPAGAVDDADFAVTGISTGRVCGVAAQSGHVYAAGNAFENGGPLYEYEAADFVVKPPAQNSGVVIAQAVKAVYVDPENGDVYADEGPRIAVLDPAGTRLYDFGYPVYFGTQSAGVAVRSAPGGEAVTAYVADSHRSPGEIDVFGPIAGAPAPTHPQVAAIGADGSASSSFSAGLAQLAFDQVPGRLYALDGGVSALYGFDASSVPPLSPLSGFSPLSTVAQGTPSLAVDDTNLGSAGNVYFASSNSGLVYGFDPSGTSLGGGFPIDPATAPGGPEGSPKFICGVAVDSAGDVWVSNSSAQRILRYSSSGASLPGSIDTSVQGGPCRLAFDSDDNLYVGSVGNVWRYSVASGYAAAAPVDTSGAPISGLAVDPGTDHLYVAHEKWVEEYDDAGAFVGQIATGIPFARFTGLTADAAHNYLYIADAGNEKVRVLGPGVLLPEAVVRSATDIANTTATLNGTTGGQGIALEDCHFEYVTEEAFSVSGFADLSSGGSAPCSPSAASIPLDFLSHPVASAVTGLSSNRTYRFRLLAADANGSSASSPATFTTAGMPLVETVGAPERTTTTARLGGRVFPRGVPTTFHFEYGEGSCESSPCAQTKPIAVGAGKVTRLVAEEISGLEPGRTYHYRLVADNGNSDGPAFGEEMTVTTRPSEAPLSHGRFPGPPGSDRAWEQVSQPETGGHPVNEPLAFSASGNRTLFSIAGGTADSENGNLFSPFFAERTASGWLTKPILPPRGATPGSPHWDLVADADLSTISAQVVSEGTEELQIWRLDIADPPRKLYERTGVESTTTHGISDDGSRLLTFVGSNVVELTGGAPKVLGIMPNGSVPACGVASESTFGFRSRHMVSPDGSLFFFASRGDICSSPGRVYVRDLVDEETKLISPPPISGPECDAAFLSSAPGAVFFFTRSRLVAEDSPGVCSQNGPDGDVYRYDLGDGALRCVTCVRPGLDADVTARMESGEWRTEDIRVAEDGSRVYFRSPVSLVPGAPSSEGDGTVYVVNVDSGELAWVAGPGIGFRQFESSLTPDGAVVFFMSSAPFLNPVGGSDNGGTSQYYRYDDRDRSFICISCPPDRSPARQGVLQARFGSGSGNGPISDDGDNIAFATTAPMLPLDQNTASPGANPETGRDVYEWRDGRYFLVTDGITTTTLGTEGPSASAISGDGRDVYFISPIQHTPDALDTYRRLFDARIGGGFDYPTPRPPCPLEVCQGTPKGIPEEAAPVTDTVAGAGNVKPRQRKRHSRHHRRRAGKHGARKQRHRSGHRHGGAR